MFASRLQISIFQDERKSLPNVKIQDESFRIHDTRLWGKKIYILLSQTSQQPSSISQTSQTWN